MKKVICLSVAGLVCIFLFWHLLPIKKVNDIPAHAVTAQRIESDEDNDEADDEDGIAEAQKMEFELTRDVKLGYIPKFRLVNAYKKLVAERELRLNTPSPNSPDNINALTWTERGPNSDVTGPSNGNTRAGNGKTSGRMRAIWVDLSDPTYHTVWVGGVDGGIWKTNDISAFPATWKPVNDFFSNLAIGGICQDPLGTKDTMYFGTGEKTYNADAVKGGGIWKSTNHGVTWSLLPATTGFYNVSKILCDARGNVYVATIGGSGIRRSLDGGNTWANITPKGLNTSVTEMKLSSTGRMHIVCGYYNGGSPGYRFCDNPSKVTDSTWTAATTVFPNVQYNCEIAVKGDSLYVLAANSSYQTPAIYKSTDGGDTWSATASSPPAASGTNDLSSGQAWYNLAITVDPANGKNVIVGGLNCYRTINGGATWAQISTWIGSSLSYIHADQQTAVWNGNQVLVGSDGGIFYSADGGATFRDRNEGLRLKQFYSCAMHPTNLNYFLAGAQDNGVHQLTHAGLASSIEVTGGDGAFVQIDQDQPQYQFGSYVYNTYRRSTNGGATWSAVDYSTTLGQFINPTDYDNVNNKMYAAGGSNQYIRWENPQTGSTFTPISIGTFGGTVRNIAISPYTSNRVFFGTSSGKIVKVDNANAAVPSATEITGTGMPATSVSCVAIGTNDSNLIATYSNYGANHIWLSTSGGGSAGWKSITGNLPDIPVRWAIFYPDDNTKAIIATEMGVYETTNINGSSTVWTQNASFPVVRTDMLKYRKSDGTVAAATHGRGLWTTTLLKTIPYIRFETPFSSQAEGTLDTTGCRYYKDYTVNMNIDLPPLGNASVTIGAVAGGTATRGVDYDFTTNGSFASPSSALVFANGVSTPKTVTIRIYDDAEIEATESFALNYTVSGTTNAKAAPSSKTYTFSITDNDVAPVANGPSNLYTVGSANYYLGNTSAGQPFNAKLPGKRNQMLYRASELTAAGITPGTITSVAFNMTKSSVRPYKNLQVKMGTTSVNNLVDVGTNVILTATVKSLASYATVNGWNTFTLNAPFSWDGTSNIAIEICYDNGTGDTTDFADRTLGYNDGSSASQGNLIWQDSINCSNSFTDVNYYSSGTKPQLQLHVTASGNLIATSGSRSENIGNNGTYYFYAGKNVLNVIKTSSAKLGCVNTVLSGTGNVWQSFYGGKRSQKVFDISPTTNPGASYSIGLYYTTAELAGKDPATLQIAKTDAAAIAGANPGNTIISTGTTYSAYASGYLFTASFTGFSKFFLAEAGAVLPVTLLSFTGDLGNNSIGLRWKTSSEIGSKYFDIQKSPDGTNFHDIGKVNAYGTSSVEHNYNFTDVQVCELNYYRLKMVDLDGRFIFSTTILIKDPNVAQRLWIGNNPFHDVITIHLAKMPRQNVKVELQAISGARIYHKEYGNTGEISVNLSGNNLSSGVYLLRTIVDGKTFVNKIIKQ